MSSSTIDTGDPAAMGVGGCPFDHHSTTYAADPQAVLRRIRDQDPVHWSDLHGGFWVVSRYEDVARITREDETFSSERVDDDPIHQGVLIPPTPMRMGFIEMDAPDHLAYRRAVLPFLTPMAVERIRPQIEQVVEEALDDVIESGHCDIVQEFTDRVPATTILQLLGLDSAQWRSYVEYFHHLIGRSYDDPGRNDGLDRGNWVLAKMAAAVAERRLAPRDDVVTEFIATQIDGELIRDDMAAEMLMLLMSGGVDTTSALLANTIHLLGHDHQLRRRLTDDPSLLPAACEEFLRLYSPVQSLARNVVQATELGGKELRVGDRLLVSWTSANFDEREFGDPERVDIDRFPNRHQAFGFGQHRCVGSNLARVEFAVALGAFLRRLGDYRIDDVTARRYETVGTNNGWMSIPIDFTPGARVLGAATQD